MHITQNLRNLFDQYSQEENRLTHSLLHTISSDEKILKDFIKFSIGKIPFDRKDKIFIGTQGKYENGTNTIRSTKTKKWSIPDALIHDKEGTSCILIESKVTASLELKQLDSHLKQIKKYKVQNPILLILTTDRKAPEGIIKAIRRRNAEVYWMPWWKIYQWMEKYSKLEIVKEFKNYIELLESNIINRNNSWEGMMTKFNGIPFGTEEPYSYNRAKWCLNSLMDEMRKSKKLKRTYRIDKIKGRPAITGSSLSVVWDLIPLAGGTNDAFTAHPHLSFVIQPEWTQIQITLPNGAKAKYWSSLMNGGKENLNNMLLAIHKNLRTGKPKKPTMLKLWVEVLQRHYRHQRDKGIRDGELQFDVDCISEGKSIDAKVKKYTVWIDALWSVLVNRKKANVQLALVVRYYHIKGSIVNKPEFIVEAERALLALKPLYNKIKE